MPRKKLNHWVSNLPDFLPNMSIIREVELIENYREEIEWLKRKIQDCEQNILQRVSLEYTDAELNAARGIKGGVNA